MHPDFWKVSFGLVVGLILASAIWVTIIVTDMAGIRSTLSTFGGI